jgi:uncharacterized membrane protein YoaK (UPF0700 family)
MPETTPRHLEYILGLTAFAAGSVDIISFTKLGYIFASAMTGNLAFLALYIAKGSLYSAIGSLIALLGFITGGAAGTLLTRDRLNHTAITILLACETILLLAAVLLWFYASHVNGRPSTDLLILLLSTAMGLQSITGKKINLSGIPTIVFTSTLTNIVIAIATSLASRRFTLATDTKRQIASFSLYFFGAFAAGVMVLFDLKALILLPAAAVATALVYPSFRRE